LPVFFSASPFSRSGLRSTFASHRPFKTRQQGSWPMVIP
jgi:hypothetical protein